MQTSRLFEIVYILLEKKTIKAHELAAHFEVSKRTILRDIDKLSATGIPVYSQPGRNGGITIMDDYVLNKTALSDEEQDYILMSLQNMAVTGNTNDKFIGKIKSFFNRENADWIEVDFSRWGSLETDKEKFEIIKSAILSNKGISFIYIDPYGRESKRNVYPLKLIFKSRAWYLQGFSKERDDYRTFKVNRITELSVSEDSFDRAKFAPPPIESQFGGRAAQVELIFSKELAFRVYDEFDEGTIEKDDGGNMRVSVRMPEDEWLYSYLMSFGDKVSVIKPKAVAAELRKRHEAAAEDK